MSLLLIEGFESLADTVDFTTGDTYEDMQNWLLALTPEQTGSFFGGSGDGIIIDSSEARISGQSLKMTRGANASGNYSNDTTFDLAFGFSPKSNVAAGAGVLIDTVPASAIPLFVWRYDTGEGEQEQASLWISPSGKLYLSETDVDTSYAGQASASVIADGASEAGVFRFGQWQYVEAWVDYSNALPQFSVRINGMPILDAVESASFRQISQNYISSFAFLNPSNGFFGEASYNMWYDDLYLATDQFYGPHQMVGLSLDTVVTDTFSSGEVASGAYSGATGGATSDAANQKVRGTVEDLPATVTSIAGVGVMLIAGNSDLELASLYFGIQDPSSGSQSKKTVSMDDADPPQLFRHITESLPGSLGFNVSGVNGMDLFVQSRILTPGE